MPYSTVKKQGVQPLIMSSAGIFSENLWKLTPKAGMI
jgi:hypothetical protein